MRTTFVPFRSFVSFVLLALASGARADIVGGEVVTEADPIRSSTAAFYSPSPDGRSGSLCTASVIGRDTALTAAHCIPRDGSHPVIIFGRTLKDPTAEKRTVSAMRVNPAWDTHRGKVMDQGDIAVVKFDGGTPEGYRSIPIASKDSVHAGESATLAGYGVSDARRKSGAGVLRKTQVAVENPRAGKSEMILDQSHGHGACHGDSGGPAFIKEGGRTVVAGVTNRSYPASAPDDCGHKVVYTKVAAYKPWIEKSEAELDRAPAQSGMIAKAKRDAHAYAKSVKKRPVVARKTNRGSVKKELAKTHAPKALRSATRKIVRKSSSNSSSKPVARTKTGRTSRATGKSPAHR